MVPGTGIPSRPRDRGTTDAWRLRRHDLRTDRSRIRSGQEVFTLAESLGGVESLIEHPGAMTHASVAGTTLEVPANLVRLSVGLEDADDLIADLEQAFRRV